jgi:beta-mannosidase
MISLILNGFWKMKKYGETQEIEAIVPGSVYNDLLNAGLMKDPFYRENEDEARDLLKYDYEYERAFEVSKELFSSDKLVLNCKGLDTNTSIYINSQLIAETNNMHREYIIDIKKYIKEGSNNIMIKFHSPLNYIEGMNRKRPLWGVVGTVPGYQHLRKAHCMFGWDWGPQLPDAGIWRDIAIIGWNYGRIEDFYIAQKHEKDKVILDIRLKTEVWCEKDIIAEVSVTDSLGNKVDFVDTSVQEESKIQLEIKNPKLWWPNGYGEQNLYKVTVNLKCDNQIIEVVEKAVGLRTLTVKREKDQWGESFEFEVNGVSIFAMGADYIPEDNILARCSPQKTEILIKDCVDANFNCIRVWGGGIYPYDYFFDLCDKYGLIVWQDFMFACAVYDLTEDFEENLRKEFEDNVKRIRHHASLGLWCGNNEMEVAWTSWGLPQDQKLKADYITLYERILPDMLKKLDPNTYYWPASPSSGGGFVDPNAENIGDVHYWEVWHGQKPFTDYRKFHFRFVSEFGFQSFPNLKTVETFTLPEDRNIFSPVMEKHQKNGSANGKILYYLSQNFKYPKDFDSLLYTSQILQAEAIKYGVEHWRRNRGRCMGAIYWQLNDCWPVASWASIDSIGRWKALHYYAKRFFTPILLSACEEGTKVDLYVSNETLKNKKVKIVWKLRNQQSGIIKEGTSELIVKQLSAIKVAELDFSEELNTLEELRNSYFEYSLFEEDNFISSSTLLFVQAKHFEFQKPEFQTQIEELEDKYIIKIIANKFVKAVEVDFIKVDGKFSDNYFDISAGEERIIELSKNRLSSEICLEELKDQLRLRSIYDISNI